MNKLLLTTGIAALFAITASAGTVTYDTNGSSLLCGAAASCVQNGATQVILGGSLTLTYTFGQGTNVVTPSIINLGNIMSSGRGSSLLTNGLTLTINVNSNPPGGAGQLPSGSISGSIATNGSSSILSFAPSNTTTSFGTLPGVVIGGFVTYQVLNTALGLQAPTVGNPIGQTTIQGTVSTTPEPGSILLLSTGLVGVFLGRKRLS